MFRKVSSFLEYVAWLNQKNKELLQQQNLFRIIKISKNKKNLPIIHIQVINKTSTFICSPNEIVCHDYLLEGFCKQDIRTITYLATEALHQPKYKIISKKFGEDLKKTLLQIKNYSMDKIEELTAGQISRNKELINAFSQEDAHSIGYIDAIEQMILEKEFFDKQK